MMWIFIISDALTFAGIPDCLWLHAKHQPGMAEADGSLQHGAYHVHDLRADFFQRRDGYGRRRSARGKSEAGIPVSCC